MKRKKRHEIELLKSSSKCFKTILKVRLILMIEWEIGREQQRVENPEETGLEGIMRAQMEVANTRLLQAMVGPRPRLSRSIVPNVRQANNRTPNRTFLKTVD